MCDTVQYMANAATATDLLGLAQRRHEYLTLLADGPRHKRDVIDELGDSRSTVDRAIEALREAGLVARTADGAWTVTTKGDVLRGTVERTREAAGAIATADDLLEYLPCDEPVPAALFQDAIVERAEGPTPLAIAERVRDNMVAADSVRGFAAADHGTGVKESAFESVFGDESFEFAYVFDESLVEGLAADDGRYRELCDRPNATGAVYDGLPFGLLLADVDDETRMTLIVYDDQRVVRGQITTTDYCAVAWGEDVFQRYLAAGTDLREWLS
jgi:predicted transcriptional regulator